MGDGLLERVEVHDDEVDRRDALGLHRGDVGGLVAQGEDAAVHPGVQRLDAPVHHLGEAGDLARHAAGLSDEGLELGALGARMLGEGVDRQGAVGAHEATADVGGEVLGGEGAAGEGLIQERSAAANAANQGRGQGVEGSANGRGAGRVVEGLAERGHGIEGLLHAGNGGLLPAAEGEVLEALEDAFEVVQGLG